jgi:hypothetical protein
MSIQGAQKPAILDRQLARLKQKSDYLPVQIGIYISKTRIFEWDCAVNNKDH